MTIDEIIKYILYAECEYCAGLSCKQNKGCIYWNILEALRELQWYREQDLIKREDAIKIFAEHIELTTDMDEGQAMFVAEHQYRRIPNAEPPKEK